MKTDTTPLEAKVAEFINRLHSEGYDVEGVPSGKPSFEERIIEFIRSLS